MSSVAHSVLLGLALGALPVVVLTQGAVTPTERAVERLPVKEILGTPVASPQGAALGTIIDLLVDPETRKVEYVGLMPAGREGETEIYPVAALVAGDRPGEVRLHPDFDRASAGASAAPALVAGKRRLLHARELGDPQALVADLEHGTLLTPPAER